MELRRRNGFSGEREVLLPFWGVFIVEMIDRKMGRGASCEANFGTIIRTFNANSLQRCGTINWLRKYFVVIQNAAMRDQ